jgi:hypothetical protein
MAVGIARMILFGLGGEYRFRSAETYVALFGTGLTPGDKLFCVVAYLPKATVQAAIALRDTGKRVRATAPARAEPSLFATAEAIPASTATGKSATNGWGAAHPFEQRLP